MNTRERPVNLDLTKFSFPVPALGSITHRITGVILFVGIAFGLYALNLSLSSSVGFARAQELIGSPLGGFIAWGSLTALAYHLFAGVKHLIMDIGFWESLRGAYVATYTVFGLTVIVSILAGVWVWA